jgi:hypothetical protein
MCSSAQAFIPKLWTSEQDMACEPATTIRATFVFDTNNPCFFVTPAQLRGTTTAPYYEANGFDANFLMWAPELKIRPGSANWAGCPPGNPHPNAVCPVGPDFGPVSDNVPDVPDSITALSWGNGFIALACGNFSEAQPDHPSPIPTISGIKFDDRNGNGVQDPTELGLGGVTIHLFNGNVLVGTTTTTADGSYSFSLDVVSDPRRGPGTYTLTEDVPPGYHQTSVPNPVVITPNPDPSTLPHPGNNFGNAKAQPTISTVPSPAVHIGANIFDSATLAGGASPTGIVTFSLYAPTDLTCATAIGTATGTLSGATTTSGNLTEATPGVYNWIASYPGDGANYDVKSKCGDEPVQLFAPITAQGTNITEVEGAPFGATMATFNDPDPVSTPAEYAATIDWGDGTATTAGTINQPGGVGTQYTVSGSHTYAEEGTYTATIKITDSTSALNTATVTTGATVSDAALKGTGVPVAAIEGLPFSGVNIGSFTDADPAGTVSDYTATVDWGDGTAHTTGTISGPDGGPFPVTGGHVYTKAGSYTITVVATDIGGATTTWTDPVAVRDAFCAGALTATEKTHIITGNVSGPMSLAGGTWIISNATVAGSVKLSSGASLMISHSSIGGSVTGTTGGELIVSSSTVGGAVISGVGEAVAVCSSTVNGAFDANATPAGVQVCATTIAGSVGVAGSTAGVMVGDPTRQCPTNRLTSAGAAIFANNLSGFDLSGNVISGSLKVSHSGGMDPPLIPGLKSAAPVIAGNTIGGSINCDGSTPPPTNAGSANRVTGPRLGQCAAGTF